MHKGLKAPGTRHSRAVAVIGLTLALPALGTEPAAAQDASRPGELRLAPCEPRGVAPPVKCGTFTVWENRDERTGRTLDLNVVLLEATGRDKRPDPVVILVGGPGQAATSIARGVSDDDLRSSRDILLVDQRGTGKSNGLSCAPPMTAPLQDFVATMDAAEVRACRSRLEQHADLRFYLTSYAMDDLDDLRAALGYDRINLIGNSYGTRAALEYIRRHGEHVRSATLMGATAFGHPMPAGFAEDAEAALVNVLRDCVAERACAQAFPNLEHDYRRAVQMIAEQGTLTIPFRDPRDDKTVDVAFRAADFAESLRAMLYNPETTRRIPALLHRAAEGDYLPFLEFQLRRNVGLAENIAEGMYFALTCTEDVARVDAAAVYTGARGTFLADHRARPHIEGCEGWPLGRLPAGFGDEVNSDVPVLLITGANDPVTPPASAHLAASRLGAARVVIVPGGGHGLGGLVGVECIAQLRARFLDTADPTSLDTTCVSEVRRRPFVLDARSAR